MMQRVSYGPCSLAFTFTLYHSSRATSLMLLNSPRLLLYYFIPPENFPVSPFLSSMHRTLYHLCPTHPRICTCYLYRLIRSLAPSLDVLCRLALVLEIRPLGETILHVQRKERFVLGARGGRVACAMEMCDKAISNSLVRNPLKKNRERHPDAFVCRLLL
jgi:hypothetical protein